MVYKQYQQKKKLQALSKCPWLFVRLFQSSNSTLPSFTKCNYDICSQIKDLFIEKSWENDSQRVFVLLITKRRRGMAWERKGFSDIKKIFPWYFVRFLGRLVIGKKAREKGQQKLLGAKLSKRDWNVKQGSFHVFIFFFAHKHAVSLAFDKL